MHCTRIQSLRKRQIFLLVSFAKSCVFSYITVLMSDEKKCALMNTCSLIKALMSRRVTDVLVIGFCTAGWNTVLSVIQTSTVLNFTKQSCTDSLRD